MKNKYILIIASCLFIVVAGVCYSCSYEKNHEKAILLTSQDSNDVDVVEHTIGSQAAVGSDIKENIQSDNSTQQELDTQSLIYVHLCGAVINPDVYQIETGARLKDLIDMAGGLSTDAASDYINQASVVKDGQRIYIPTKEELEELSLSDYIEGEPDFCVDKAEVDGKVNINTADETKFMNLTGIGQAKAKSIVEYRNKNGEFKDITDLMKIPGIKEGLFNQIKDEITLGNAPNK